MRNKTEIWKLGDSCCTAAGHVPLGTGATTDRATTDRATTDRATIAAMIATGATTGVPPLPQRRVAAAAAGRGLHLTPATLSCWHLACGALGTAACRRLLRRRQSR